VTLPPGRTNHAAAWQAEVAAIDPSRLLLASPREEGAGVLAGLVGRRDCSMGMPPPHLSHFLSAERYSLRVPHDRDLARRSLSAAVLRVVRISLASAKSLPAPPRDRSTG